ncbi:MAG: anhydro-N-acetylmuramic acid kinase [Rhodothermales bacterium]|nr:anhydro-N-acetylmuramic acid kinase [Rhodothermales bacterium]
MPDSQPPVRLVAGVMSGTSLDGVDVAIARLAGSGRGMTIELAAFSSIPYPTPLRDLLLANSAPETSSVRHLSQLNVRLAHVYAAAIRTALERMELKPADLDLIGLHGQTVHHVPDAEDCAGVPTRSTLQIGDGSTLANLLGVPVVGDFRMADMALGGQGAPLVPYFDYVFFGDDAEHRALLNIGGIANITVLPAGAPPSEVFAFDTGPGNMLIDALARQFFDRAFDHDGRIAAGGRVRAELLDTLLADPYLARIPPKSTGREYYGRTFVDWFVAQAGRDCSPEDLLATVTAYTAAAVADAIERFVSLRIDAVIASGGGVRNPVLMAALTERLAPVRVSTTDQFGLDADAKEALCFAVLGHETMQRVATGMPRVTGATKAALAGKICLPSR